MNCNVILGSFKKNTFLTGVSADQDIKTILSKFFFINIILEN